MPFDFHIAPNALCGACSRARPPYERARAVLRYDDESRPLVLAFKHGDRLHLAPAFGRWMARTGAPLWQDADYLVPVPLHWTRLFARRYNQAALLAHVLHKLGGPPVATRWLVRKRRTPSQGRKSGEARRRNVQGAFAVRRDAPLKNKKLILIDDVMTSGATLHECARTLLRAGAERVDVLTLARIIPKDTRRDGVAAEDDLY